MVGKSILHYKIKEKLGEGGMGVVYLAEDTNLDRLVAIKFLPDHISSDSIQSKRFEIEAKAAAALNHPNIATIHAIEKKEEKIFLVMEYIEGRELKSIIKDQLSKNEVLDYAIQIAEGLQAAHNKGIIHRDIKSSNIMITDQGRVKIMDFGLAKSKGSTPITQLDTTVGTVAYMSPEQIKGEEIDVQSDIWSFGVVLYEMLYGDVPFKADYDQAVMYSIVNEEPNTDQSRSLKIPEYIDDIVHKTLQKEKNKRYSAMAEVLKDLKLKIVPKSRSKMLPARYLIIFMLIVAVAYFIWNKVQQNFSAEYTKPEFRLKQVTFAAELEEYPSFSTDGKKIAFSRQIDHHKQIIIKDLTSGEEKQITTGVRDNIQATFDPQNPIILFVRSNTADGKLEPGDVYGEHIGGDIWEYNTLTGNERKLIENGYNPSLSVDGKRLVFDAEWAGPRRIWMSDNFGRNPVQLSYNSSEAVVHILPKWSPDGKRIAYQVIEKTKMNIVVMDLKNKNEYPVTDDLYTNLNPVWSPTGDAIYLSSYRSGGRNIWRIPITEEGSVSGNPEQITTGAGEDVQLTIDSQGSIAFTTLKINADIWQLPVSGQTGKITGNPVPVIQTTREDSRGAWSADGEKIAFNSDRSGDMNIWIYSIKDKKQTQITKGAGGDFQPNWSADSKEIVFFSSRKGNADIWKVDVQTHQLTQLSKNNALDMNPFYSPDGKKIAFQSDREGRREVWVMNNDGLEQKRLTDSGCSGHFMRWTADSKYIVYHGLSDGNKNLTKVSLDGKSEPFAQIQGGSHISFSPDYSKIMDVTGHNTLWITSLGTQESFHLFPTGEIDFRIDYPVWSPDGKWILFDRVKPQGGDIWVLESSSD